MEEMLLISPKGDDVDTDFDHTLAAGPSRVRNQYGAFTEKPRQSTDSTKEFRFIVLGHNEHLMSQACSIILRLGQGGDTNVGTCELRDGIVNGQPVSVVKTPSSWLKSFSIFSFRRKLNSIKSEIEFCQSLVFPGPHAFLLVIKDVKTGKEKILLQALSEVFGIKALDFCMVLLMQEFQRKDIQNNDCVRKCKYRNLFLRNTDQGVEKLFQKTKEMIEPVKFFTYHLDCFEKAKLYFDKEFETERRELLKMKKNETEEIEKRNEMLQRENNQLKVQLDSALMQIQEQLQAIKEQLSERVRDLNTREKLLETRERDLSAQRYIQSSGDIQYGHHSSTAVTSPGAFVYKYEREEETEDDSGASGSQLIATKRRNSNEMGKPNMSTSEHTPLQSL
ncbi:GTPase IMAP family member 4-like [Sinocyclocheilus anshuiensis]|uniref:GTPase IMAP family member 4-like n=1 Tax=Sinocyclocheilus anshuiensis TaxID=1608454 RepID=UPI0007BA976F|nr:PREDICTED: GTPase IMAP family member 4-like [Sinocyclocheilus anshuiensis]